MLSVVVEVDSQWERYNDVDGKFLRALRHIDPSDGGLLQWYDHMELSSTTIGKRALSTRS